MDKENDMNLCNTRAGSDSNSSVESESASNSESEQNGEVCLFILHCC